MSPPFLMLIGVVASTLTNVTPEHQRMMLDEHDMEAKVTGMLLEMDQTEILHLLESPNTLKAKVAEAMEVLRKVSQQQTCNSAVPDVVK
ncbi:hypothetical protein HHK36_028743 [Tetracentron sinense]|uniref:PABC domain-containing protein n=1 Tax=Tetracentron sinense TaxID=13715 RepID=A0A834YFL1_TETSI|nr:hypothetical protein HHK36_028743 [Tetracentron sinense]